MICKKPSAGIEPRGVSGIFVSVDTLEKERV